MKKLLPILGFTFLMAACNTTPDPKPDAAQSAQQILAQPDTTGMAAFNAWKAQNELVNMNSEDVQQAKATPKKTKTIVKYVPVKQSAQSKPASSSTSTTSNSGSTSESTNSGSSAETGSGSETAGTAETAKVEKKEEKRGKKREIR